MGFTNVTTHKDTQVNIAYTEEAVQVTYLEKAKDDFITFSFAPTFAVSQNTYILCPACCYKGNQFSVLKKDYPPLFLPEEAMVDMPVTITDVPRLSIDGSGAIDITTGDLSVPCIALFSCEEKKAWFLFTIQQINGNNLGIRYENGNVQVTYPHMRKQAYRWPHMGASQDLPLDFEAGDQICLPYHIIECECSTMEEFYRIFFENRKCMGMDSTRYQPIPFDQQAKIQIEKYNAMNWMPGGFYSVWTSDAGLPHAWQPGWMGGGMSSYALMKLGGKLEEERALQTLEFLVKTQAASGFFWDAADRDGNKTRVMEEKPYSDDWHLIRKSADALYFMFKYFRLMEKRAIPIGQHLLQAARKCADAFVKMWQQYGQFGQFVHLETGEIIAGGSTAGAMAGAALCSAAEYFGVDRYLEVAEACTKMYCDRDAYQGYTTGGPGEILQCPDSESAFALLESAVVLHEKTKKQEWLDWAVYLVHFCSSWVVAYNYAFIPGSEFYDKGMKTTGAVWANAQNKHAAPGPCTVSGDSLYKVYSWTKDPLILELFLDVTMTVSQYMSTDERPIWSWDVPKDASLLNDDSLRAPREKLPAGFICERVNMSDWESKRCIGGVFNGSCWCEVTNLLILAECTEFPEVIQFINQ